MKKKILLMCIIVLTITGLLVAPSTVFGEYSDPGDPEYQDWEEHDPNDDDPDYNLEITEIHASSNNIDRGEFATITFVVKNTGSEYSPTYWTELHPRRLIEDEEEIIVPIDLEPHGNPDSNNPGGLAPGEEDPGWHDFLGKDLGNFLCTVVVYTHGENGPQIEDSASVIIHVGV